MLGILASFIIGMFFFFVPLGFSQDNTAGTAPSLEGLRDVKAPVFFPSNALLIIVILLVAVIGVIIVWYLFFKVKKNKVEETPADTRLPWEIAYQQLDELERSSLLEEGQFKVYYSRLSDIIRKYFEHQFGVRAPEMTTEEFLSNDLTVTQKSALKKFLSSCDIVKFAKYIPQLTEGKASFQFARELVQETKTRADQSPTNPQ
jgi:hypothetical protein